MLRVFNVPVELVMTVLTEGRWRLEYRRRRPNQVPQKLRPDRRAGPPALLEPPEGQSAFRP